MRDIYRTFGIYRITNKINGVSYIGETRNNFGDRWDCHRAQLNGGYHNNKNLQAAWNQYGANNFEFRILEETSDVESLDELEIKYIKQYADAGLAYNIASGGIHGGSGLSMSEETKRKIGAKNRVNMTGRKASEETRRKMSESHKKRCANMTNEDRERVAELGRKNKGRKWSDEARKNFSKAQQTRPDGSRYSIDEVREIRRLHEKCNKSYKEISKIMNIHVETVRSIATYRRWKYV